MISQEELVSIYRETVHPLYLYVSRRTGGRKDLTEDIVQETFVRAWQNWHRRCADNPLAWLKAVAHNLLVNYFRQLKPYSLDEMKFDPVSGTPSDTPDDVTWVQAGLTRIKRSYSEILEMFYFEEMNFKEISDQLNTTEKAVEGRMRRARLALSKQLQRLKNTDGGSPK